MRWHLDRTTGAPFHLQIIAQVENSILAGQLRVGDQLPTIRDLAIELGVNFNTVAYAYRLLAQRGRVVLERGRGTTVCQSLNAHEQNRQREKKLRELVKGLLTEAERLGYSRSEIAKTCRDIVR